MKPGRRYSCSIGPGGDASAAERRLLIPAIRRDVPWDLLPSPVVHRVLVGGAGRNEAPTQRPLIVVVEAFARVGRGRRVEETRELEIAEIDQAAGFLEQIVGILLRVVLDRLL